MTAKVANRPPAPRGKRGEYAKSADTRLRILEAARAIAGDAGFHGVSVSKIAERAGIAVGNLHYHFGSLEDLLRELMLQVTEEITNGALLAIEHSGGFFEREEGVFRSYLAFVHRNPTYVRLAEEVRVHHPDIYNRTLSLWLELTRASIRDGIDTGDLRPMSDDEIGALAHYLIGARYFLDQMLAGVHGGEYPGDEVVVAAYMALLRGGLAAGTGEANKKIARKTKEKRS